MEAAAWVGAGAATIVALLALYAAFTQPFKKLREDLGGRIDAVAQEWREAHAAIGDNIQRLREDLGGRIDGVQTEMGKLRQDVGKLQGSVEQLGKK